jgi:hypothetical protein
MFNTQASSKPRLKNDTLGEDTLKQLYDAYTTMDDMMFEALCVSVVQAGGGKQPMKDSIINAIYSTKSKSTKLKKAQDFILAGLGLGV